MKDHLRAKVNVKIETVEDGRITFTEEKHNLVVDSGLDWLIHWMAKASGYSALTILQVGVGGTAPTAEDTMLENYRYSGTITEYQYAGSTLTIKYYLSSLYANDNTLTEAGLFDSEGHMFARVVHSGIIKNDTTGVIYTWTITLDVV